jgi:hypothetical protein
VEREVQGIHTPAERRLPQILDNIRERAWSKEGVLAAGIKECTVVVILILRDLLFPDPDARCS